MFLALWSPKGGSGTSVVAASCALVLARLGPVRLVDLDGDQPGLLGLAAEPDRGVGDWLAAGADAPAGALDRLACDVTAHLDLLGLGGPDPGSAVPEAGAALGVCLRDGGRDVVVDLGCRATPAALALAELADAVVVVARGCYLTLRRGARAAMLPHTDALAFVVEPGRSLTAADAADVLGVPAVAEVPVRSAIARAVDAGVLPGRIPDALARPTRRLLAHLGADGVRGAA